MNSASIRKIAFGALILAAVGESSSHLFAQHSQANGRETVNLRYELVLSRCKIAPCQRESVARGDISIKIEAEDHSFAWGYEAPKVHTGRLDYYLRLKASRYWEDGRTRRAFDIGFSGVLSNSRDPVRVTFAEEKHFMSTEWAKFPKLIITGTAYSENQEMVTPTLVLWVKPR